MPPRAISDDELHRTIDVWWSAGRSRAAAARTLGLSVAGLDKRMSIATSRGMIDHAPNGQPRPADPALRNFKIDPLPDEDAPVDEILKRRTREFERRSRANDARKLVRVRVADKGPIGIAIFGDLHIDSPGCNLPLLRSHIELVKKTPGLYAGCIGDLQDGWVGRLARLWATQGVTAKESLKLVRWYMEQLQDKLLFIVEGNHDSWCNGVNGISPIEWIAAHTGTLTQSDGVRLSIDLGGESWIMNARHDFRGRSQWNAAHGGTKAAMMGWRDDIMVAGHTHESGYNIIKDPKTGMVTHVLRVASYKHIDAYAKTEGFPDNNSFECPVVILRPRVADNRFRTQTITDPFLAAKCLGVLRREASRG
jgi:UDP-2,3-diacylglucosamine pyrophosphatase LpxH